MNLFEAKSIYDSKTGKFLEEFYINGESVDCDVYYFYLEREKDTEDKKLENKKQETADDSPYTYDKYEECSDECDKCKYKDKKKYKDCDDNCKYMNCDECCNDFCDCENEDCEECDEYEGCKDDEFDYGDLLEVFTCRIMEVGKDYKLVKNILDEFADIFIPDYDEDELEDDGEDCDECCNCQCTCECENKEFTDEQLAEIDLIEEFTDNIINIKCGAELRNELYRLYSTGKSIGWNDHCCFIQKLMDDGNYKDYKESKESKEIKTNITCNLTVNNTKEDMNKATEQIFNMINNAIRCG